MEVTQVIKIPSVRPSKKGIDRLLLAFGLCLLFPTVVLAVDLGYKYININHETMSPMMGFITDSNNMQTVSGEHFVEAIRWIAGVVVALGVFVGGIVRWMMVRLDNNQKTLEQAVAGFTSSVDSWKRIELDIHEAQKVIMNAQNAILSRLDLAAESIHDIERRLQK